MSLWVVRLAEQRWRARQATAYVTAKSPTKGPGEHEGPEQPARARSSCGVIDRLGVATANLSRQSTVRPSPLSDLNLRAASQGQSRSQAVDSLHGPRAHRLALRSTSHQLTAPSGTAVASAEAANSQGSMWRANHSIAIAHGQP